MQKIIFKDKNHRYIRESDGVALMSVSHFCSLFSPPFNGEHHARKSAAKIVLGASLFDKLKKEWYKDGGHMLMPEFVSMLESHVPDKAVYEKLIKKTKKDWKKSGEDAAADGTAAHSDMENESLDSGMEYNELDGNMYPVRVHGKKPNGDNETVAPLSDLEWGFYPELLLWYFFPETVFSESMNQWVCGIAGQADKPFLYRDRTAFIEDLKTNKDISDYGINYPNFGYEMHLGPWADMRLTKRSKYKIQLPTYGWMLEQQGYNVKGTTILHKTGRIPVPYTPDLVEAGVSKVFTEGM